MTETPKILIAAALYPPDVTDPAPYIKALATRLSRNYRVTLLVYGNLPEQISGVSIKVVPKHIGIISRLVKYTTKLWQLTKQHDVVLVQNAPSTELPATLVGLLYKSKLVLQHSDQKVSYSGLNNLIHTVARWRTRAQIELLVPAAQLEVIPFSPPTAAEYAAFETAWSQHLTSLKPYLV